MRISNALVTRSFFKYLMCLTVGLVWAPYANAVTLTFDEVIAGETSFSFDADGDLQPDAVFTTTDPSGFNTTGPGPNQLYIEEPGLEGTTNIVPDLKVDFPNGAVNSLGFGFAVSAGAESPNLTVTFQIFDSGDNLLATTTDLAVFTEPTPPTPSGFPEALVSLSFVNKASYATLDFNDADAGRYIIDNFTGTFGSTEDITPGGGAATPIPTMSAYGFGLMVLGMLLIASRRLRISSRRR